MEGWIKLHRKMLDNPIIWKDSDYIAVWVYLLLNATHKPHDTIFGGNRITLQPGQLVTGRNVIATKLSISSSKVERILKVFKSEQQIEQRTTTQNRLISIVRWNEYQRSEQQSGQRVDNEWTASEHIQE